MCCCNDLSDGHAKAKDDLKSRDSSEQRIRNTVGNRKVTDVKL